MRLGCIDVGTTSVKLAVYGEDLEPVHFEAVGVPLEADGTHDPAKLLGAVRHLVAKAREAGVRSVGLATYRASMVAWDREGRPLSPVLTWLSSTSASRYRRLPWAARLVGRVPPLNLIVSPYSPALRYLTLWDEVGAKRIAYGEAMVWTLESFLAYALTGRYVSDASNAALTGLVDPSKFREIGFVCNLLGVRPVLPEIVDNTEPVGEYGGVEIGALCGDQQAACVGDACVSEGLVKITNGTGTFVDAVCGHYRRKSGLIPIVVLRHRGTSVYGLEGYLPTSGLAVEALRRLGVVSDYGELDGPLEGGVLFVPALGGLQIPSAPEARGAICNIGLDVSRRQLVSGLVKSVAFHVRMVLERSGVAARAVRANGKLSKSTGLLKAISATLGLPVERQADVEATLRGLALLQLLGEGALRLDELEATRRGVEVIRGEGVHLSEEEYRRWLRVVGSLKSWTA